MALIEGVNYRIAADPLVLSCDKGDCSAPPLFRLRRETQYSARGAFYCLEHLLKASHNIHAVDEYRDAWL
jgi:hypothetical protein